MTLNLLRTSAAFVFSTVLLASSTLAQTHAAAPESAYGGVVVEDIVARVNDQIITRSDYDRAMKQLDDEARQHGATMQQISEGHKDLLRDLIDQQLWLSKGKELEITGETELVQKLNELRKQFNLETIDDLKKAAEEQGVSFEDFKASIRNQIVTQLVMREEVGRRIQITPGEVQRYFDEHKQEYMQPESVHLSEILVSGGADPSDAAADAAAKAKVDDIEAKLHAGGDFTQLAKNFSDGPTAADGGDLGEYLRGKLNPVFETKAFALKTGDFTEPIRTKQGYVILKVVQHVPGGVQAFKDVQDQVEQNYYMSRMAPAIREYLTTMREQAAIDIKTGYVDSGASPKETKPIYSSYTPPAPKKRKKVERTRFRESTRTFRQKSQIAAGDAPPPRQQKRTPVWIPRARRRPARRKRFVTARRPPRRFPARRKPKPRTRAQSSRRPRAPRRSRRIRLSQRPGRSRRPASAIAPNSPKRPLPRVRRLTRTLHQRPMPPKLPTARFRPGRSASQEIRPSKRKRNQLPLPRIRPAWPTRARIQQRRQQIPAPHPRLQRRRLRPLQRRSSEGSLANNRPSIEISFQTRTFLQE